MTTLSGEKRLRFGVFEINTTARELRKHGVKVRLSGQPLTILEILLQKPGQVVTREELQKSIWPADTFVDFDQGLNGAVKKLRDALGDGAETPRYIETLPKIGYRFIAPVSDFSDVQAGVTLASPSAVRVVVATPGIPHARRLPKWMALAAIAICAIAASTAAILYFRKAPAIFREKDTIVIGSFDNFTAEPVFDNTLRQALFVGMQQTPFLHVVSEHRAAEILRQMGHKPEEKLTAKASIELCQRVGSKVVTQGAIRSLGTNYVLDLTAVRCDNGEPIAQEQVVAGRKEDVIDALGQAAARIRAKLGESLPSIEKYNAPLEQATTPSLEALKAYGLGAELWEAGGDHQAKPYFERAVELDPNFAVAYGALAAIHENDGEHELAKQFATKAYENRDRATGIEKLLIESWYDIYALGDIEKAAHLYEIGLRDYPENARMLNDLGVIDASLGNYRKGAELFRESLRLDPSSATTYGNLAVSLMALDQTGEVGKILNDAEKRQLSFEYLQQVRYWLAFLRHDAATMEALVEQTSAQPVERAALLAEQANSQAYAGQLEAARKSMEEASSLISREGDQETSATFLAQGAVRAAEFGEAAEARQLTTRALKLSRGPDVEVLAALALARSGDSAAAETLAQELNAAHPTHTEIQKYWLPLIHAQIALQSGDAGKAIDVLETTAPYEMASPSALATSTFFPAYLRGEAFLSLGNGEQAAVEFNKLLDHPGMTLNYPLGPLAKLGMARSLAQKKEFTKAGATYQELFQVWQSADSNLRILKEAKAEFARLPAQ
jgi:DNA-binding winged helix-turn-helix (wHTH) protein/tetratricopeptide (TPR) repeat protein